MDGGGCPLSLLSFCHLESGEVQKGTRGVLPLVSLKPGRPVPALGWMPSEGLKSLKFRATDELAVSLSCKTLNFGTGDPS